MSVYNRKSWIYGGRKHWIHNGRHYSSRIKRKKRFKTGRSVGKMKKNGFWIFNNFERNGIRFKTKSWFDFEKEFYTDKIANEIEDDYFNRPSNIDEKLYNFNDSFLIGDYDTSPCDDEILNKIYEDDEEFERQIYIDSQIYDLDGY